MTGYSYSKCQVFIEILAAGLICPRLRLTTLQTVIHGSHGAGSGAGAAYRLRLLPSGGRGGNCFISSKHQAAPISRAFGLQGGSGAPIIIQLRRKGISIPVKIWKTRNAHSRSESVPSSFSFLFFFLDASLANKLRQVGINIIIGWRFCEILDGGQPPERACWIDREFHRRTDLTR